ncbi:MAG: DUF3071 domain-containing protein [Propionibacteriaceae bacterium]|nr:DUF3071 domain-containing protein [Propionibacteriaceae bacterium]
MRTALPVGLSQDGRTLIVSTPSGEELAVPVDDRLHAALRGDRPRLGQLEIEMENALGPRDIQSRIRAGQSLEDVGRVAGIPLDRVERFAAPVLAEREHVALVAMSSSVRRRGETSGHRNLRVALTERLLKRGVDIDTITWDAYRLDDGRWSVSAEYLSGEANRKAVFLFDLQGRFSVAGNDEARWALGEQSSVKGPQPGRKRPEPQDGDPDAEPTLDLSDELAIVRVVQPPEGAEGQTDRRQDNTAEGGDDEPGEQRPSPLAGVRGLFRVPDRNPTDDRLGEPNADAELSGAERAGAPKEASPDQGDDESPLDTLSSMLDSDRDLDDTSVAYGGLSDASAVPDTDNTGWEPEIVVDYPVEPSPDTPAAPQVPVEGAEPSDEAAPPAEDAVEEQPAPRPPGKRKRAAVPSWDEIMFGGPKRSG